MGFIKWYEVEDLKNPRWLSAKVAISCALEPLGGGFKCLRVCFQVKDNTSSSKLILKTIEVYIFDMIYYNIYFCDNWYDVWSKVSYVTVSCYNWQLYNISPYLHTHHVSTPQGNPWKLLEFYKFSQGP